MRRLRRWERKDADRLAAAGDRSPCGRPSARAFCASTMTQADTRAAARAITGQNSTAFGLTTPHSQLRPLWPKCELMDEPERTKAGLREAYRRLLDLDFNLLLLAHGDPVVGGAKDALRRF